MSNIEIHLPLVDGSGYTLLDLGESGEQAIHTLFTDDFAAPPRSLIIKIHTESGKEVEVGIPYSDSAKTWVRVDKKTI